MARETNAWGHRKGTGADSIDIVLMDATHPLTIPQIENEIRSRGLKGRGGVGNHLQHLKERGFAEKTARGWFRIERQPVSLAELKGSSDHHTTRREIEPADLPGTQEEQLICYFNNCHNRDHIAWYGSGAFFDLMNSGKQATQARNLLPGQVCVVASYTDEGQVTLNWYSFTHEALLPDEHDELERVFFGRLLNSETVLKSKAARSICYSALFKRTGDFKQGSVFWNDVATTDLPKGVQERHSIGAKGSKRPTAGAGFGDPLENKLVEVAAIRAVKRTYERDGWSVRSVERDRCGFDLECSKKGLVEDIEVKGVRGSQPCFIITAGEVEQARNNQRFYLMVVTSALSLSPMITKYSGADFCRQFQLSAIQYRAALQS